MVAAWQFALIGVLVVALVTDLQSRRIYNWLTFPAMLAGLVMSVAMGGLGGLQSAGLGLLVGSAFFVIGFVTGGMGAGDVKLMAAVGLWLGWPATLSAVIYVTLVGGVLSLVAAAANGNLKLLFKNVYWYMVGLAIPGGKPEAAFINSAAPPLPYGVSIVIGTVVALFFPDVIALLHGFTGT